MALITPVSALTDHDFQRVREMAYAACGLSIHAGKQALVSSRLQRVVRRNGFDTFSGYLNFLSQRTKGQEFIEFIDTLTTNHSAFWREPEHFQFLQKSILPNCRTRSRIWSAACATGEEPYTIGMCVLECGAANCRIAASDISRKALNAAIKGVYEVSRLSGLPAGWESRYFQKESSGEAMRVKEPLRAMVDFGPLNLLEPFHHLGTFDVVFCRNVMIYFDQPTRDSLILRLTAQLAAGGYLLTGHSETLLRAPENLEYIQPAVYRKR